MLDYIIIRSNRGFLFNGTLREEGSEDESIADRKLFSRLPSCSPSHKRFKLTVWQSFMKFNCYESSPTQFNPGVSVKSLAHNSWHQWVINKWAAGPSLHLASCAFVWKIRSRINAEWKKNRTHIYELINQNLSFFLSTLAERRSYCWTNVKKRNFYFIHT